MTSVQEELAKLHKEASNKAMEAERLARLSASFPDLKKHVGRWDKVAYYSAEVNSKVDQVEFRYNCGCCSDSPLEAWPYLNTTNGRVYSDPPCFQVGEKHHLGGSRPYSDWKPRLEKVGLSGAVIQLVSDHFGRGRADRIAAAEADDLVVGIDPII
jgi:hypothetical protein